MGEIADMMMDGTICAGCGEYLDHGEGDGIPRYCGPECEPKPAPPRKKKTAAQRKARALKQRRRRARKRVAAELAGGEG